MNKEEVILAVRHSSKFRNSVLGRAQINCPLAYQEFIQKRNPTQTIGQYFSEMFGIWSVDDGNQSQLDELFRIREKKLSK